ncbi:DUF3592 domain-containing protein [Aporhodopirellula aestuarii]|uniref:DUF3592 domain-containing protein n=1 Tax=Aporhodopirellula aestuarii TaxID=2950107 RepID=A0ABT0U734_9BACT|nr:DUF3592 domain-containing protein [Aporhodopirellula aestuarii]MCM2372739.1 hypothetical protein [Aporhodopirellula aestuarii]
MPSENDERIEIKTTTHVPRQAPNLVERRAGAQLTLAGSVIICGLSLLIIASGIGEVRRGIQRANLPHTKGLVTKSVATAQIPEAAADATPFVRIEYEYIVDAETYTNDLMRFGISNSEAQATIERYPLQEQVMIAYWPSNPEASYLYPSNAFGYRDFKDLLYGVIFLVFSLIIGTRSVGKLRNTRRVQPE